jgi:hypothetical protein
MTVTACASRLTGLAWAGALALLAHTSAWSQASPSADAPPDSVPVADLRAVEWRSTSVQNTSMGVVQHSGDDIFPDGTVGFLRRRLSVVLASKRGVDVQLKTSDIQLFVPDVKVDPGAVGAAQRAVPAGAMLAAPVAALLSSFSKNKSASAVFCLAVGGSNYLGNDARLFRVGAESELKASIEAAVATLAQNIAAGKPTTSPACEPGWEGGQPRRE